MVKKNLLLSVIFIGLCLCGCSGKFKSRNSSINYDVLQVDVEESKILPPIGKLTIGEKLSYKISWLGLSVGEATLMVKNTEKNDGQETALVELTAYTTGFFRLIYKVDGIIHSYVDMATFKPIKYDSDTRINKKIIIKKMKYDFNEHKVYVEDKKSKYVVDINDAILDPLGVFYYFRKNNIILNEPIDILVNGGKKNFPVRVFSRSERLLKVPAGTFWAFQVEPTDESERQFDDALNAEGSMRIWFSSDERRLPLLIALKVPVGSAIATLMAIEYTESSLTQN
ncbi:MAG: DUF3108 domain-containing protein [Candidatus Omnitrophica bacterium]|nr:DUF3108 domain-containing protein [Candidatus Omnitrophota bacterium]